MGVGAQGLACVEVSFFSASCQPPNKQFERTVTPNRGRGAPAPIEY